MVLIWFKNGGSSLHFFNLIRFYDGVIVLEPNDVIKWHFKNEQGPEILSKD